MSKATILLAAVLAVGLSTNADAAKKKAAAPKPDPAVASWDNSHRFVADALQPWRSSAPAAAPARKGKKK